MSFEATPYYLFHPHAAERAACLVPDAAIIALLRDPVARAFSHYRHEVRFGREKLSFEEAVAAEPGRIGAISARMEADPTFMDWEHHRQSYVARGLYAEQLERWMRHYPRERILVVAADDLYGDPAATYSRILEFVGLPRWLPSQFANFTGPVARADRSRVASSTRAQLEEYYAPANRRLYELIGRDLGWPA